MPAIARWGLLSCLMIVAATSPASQFRGDSAHTGVYPTSAPAQAPKARWTFQTEGPVRSSPVVEGDALYVGSGDGSLYKLATKDGRMHWKYTADLGVHSTPAVAESVVLFTTRKALYALDKRSGKLSWKFDFQPDLRFDWGVDYWTSSPNVDNDRVYVGAGDGHLYCLEASSGKQVWKLQTGHRVRSSPAVADGLVLVGNMGGQVVAADASNGVQKWSFATMGAGLDNAKFGFDRKTLQSSPAVSGGAVSIGSRDGLLYSVDLKTGKENWRFANEPHWVISSPAAYKGLVIAGSSDGYYVNAVNASDGKEKWRFVCGTNVFSSPSVANGLTYFTTFNGYLFGVDVDTGVEAWRYKLGDMSISSPTPHEGSIYVGSDDGKVYALEGPTSRAAQVTSLEKKFVYFHPTAKWRNFRGGEGVRDYLRGEGYASLNQDSLWQNMKELTSSKTSSVIVFASEALPGYGEEEQKTFRAYLDSGGKVVWLGVLPFFLEANNDTGEIAGIRPDLVEKVLGAGLGLPTYGEYGFKTTSEGLTWGLPTWGTAGYPVDLARVDTALSLTEDGQAATWVKRYGGKPGTGFVRGWGRTFGVVDPKFVKVLAEGGF
jgi:outer membrane protein assembly factor BamB